MTKGEQFIAKAKGLNRKAWFELALKTFDRIAIAGGPNSGKTTLCRLVKGRPVFHTDEHKHLAWEAVPHAVIAEILNESAIKQFVVEGVQVPRTLRKGLEVDAVLWLNEALEPNSKGQEAMRKGCQTVLAEWYATHKDVPVLQAPAVKTSEDNDDE